MYSIESGNLGRTIWVTQAPGEREALIDDGVPEGNIYSADEIKALRGISLEALKAVQLVKDVFPGSVFDSHGEAPDEPRQQAQPVQKQQEPEPQQKSPEKGEQLKLL